MANASRLMVKIRQHNAKEAAQTATSLEKAESATSVLGAQPDADADKAKSQLSIGKRRRRSTAGDGLAKKTLLGG